MSKKARSLVFLGPSDGEKVLLCFKWGVLNYALECRLDGVQNHSRSRPYPCTRAFSDGVGWPSPLLHGREDFWVIIVFCCWVGILCVCFQVDIVLQLKCCYLFFILNSIDGYLMVRQYTWTQLCMSDNKSPKTMHGGLLWCCHPSQTPCHTFATLKNIF